MPITKRSMRWTYRDDCWWYGDGVGSDLYKIVPLAGKWIVYCKKVYQDSFKTFDEAKVFIPKHYVESHVKINAA